MIGNRMRVFALSTAFICLAPPANAAPFDGTWTMLGRSSASTIRNGGSYTALIKRLRYTEVTSSMTDPKESYIIAQALYEFVRCEQAKPIDERRISDVEDAKAILHSRFDNELAILMKSDEAAGREPPDCWRKASIGG